MAFDLSSLKQVLDRLEPGASPSSALDDFSQMLAALEELEREQLFTEPAIRAFCHWRQTHPYHSFPKRQQGWINTIACNFSQLKIYLTVNQVESYISGHRQPSLVMRHLLGLICQNRYYEQENLADPDNPLVVVTVECAAEPIYHELVKRNYIAITGLKRARMTYKSDYDGKADPELDITPAPKRKADPELDIASAPKRK